MPLKILILGAGDLATGVASRLFNSGMQIVMTELNKPTVVRRKVAFAEAINEGIIEVEDITAVKAKSKNVFKILAEKKIPIVVEDEKIIVKLFNPDILIDARMLKKDHIRNIDSDLFSIGLGPGFTVNKNCDVVIETNRGHFLGSIIWQGSAEPNTSVPGKIKGKESERIMRAPKSGEFNIIKDIGELVNFGEVIAVIDDTEIIAPISGVIRGLLSSGVITVENMKIGDVDPRGDISYCYSISDKARAIGGSVLEAILSKGEFRKKLSE